MQHIETEGIRSERIELLTTPEEKALLMRAAEIAHLDINSFIMRVVLPAALDITEQTERDTQQMQHDRSQNTGADLIASFRNSSLGELAFELERELERDRAASRVMPS